MKTKKEQVLAFLANLPSSSQEQFNVAFDLYNKSANNNPNLLNHFNKSGNTPTTLNSLIYELKKLHSISDRDIRKEKHSEGATAKVINSVNSLREAFSELDVAVRNSILVFFKFMTEFDYAPEEAKSDTIKEYITHTGKLFFDFIEKVGKPTPEEFENSFKEELAVLDYPEGMAQEIINLRASIGPNPVDENLNTVVTDSIDLSQEIEIASEKVFQAFETASDEVKNEIRFRDEFPFINDPNLAPELKQLVTDKFSHYHAFAETHKSLSHLVDPQGNQIQDKVLSNEEIFALAKKAVVNFEMDQLIRDEFVYYKENNKVLGAHPIFKQRKVQESVNLMTAGELAKRAGNLENYIRRDRANGEKAKTDADKTKFADKVLDWEYELALVNVKLGNVAPK
ncbi:hypothetical protein ACI6PS_02515 [Flavobacterium sp. PLA-1-15]|uniref:hypothetical protein n=1 Tax=Flavobacterium sp. PLA-1-15 TaxID=3380533 RepID=UPI003B7960EE